MYKKLIRIIKHNLLFKVVLTLIIPLLSILIVFTIVEYNQRRQTMLDNLSYLAAQTSQVIEDGIRHEMLNHDIDGLQNMLDAINESGALRTLNLLDTSGKVVFAPHNSNIGLKLDNSDPTCQPCHSLPVAERTANIVVTLPDGQRIFRSMIPIENQPECQECHPASQRLNGLLLTDISMAPLEAPISQDLRNTMFWLGGSVAVTIILVYMGLKRIVIHPLKNIAQALNHFGEGQFDMRLPVESADEVGQIALAFNEMSQHLQENEIEKNDLANKLRHESTQRIQLLRRLIYAQEEERKRVARDLHDVLGQDLAGIAIGLENMGNSLPDRSGKLFSQIQQTRQLIIETTQRAYELILSLRPSALDDVGLTPVLRTYTERTLKNTGIQFEIIDKELEKRLPPEIETAVFRVFQEALNNIIRHSNAKNVTFILKISDQIFTGQIIDDGIGFNLNEISFSGTESRGLGLLGMRERIEQCGGTLEFISLPSGGVCIRIKIPIQDLENEG